MPATPDATGSSGTDEPAVGSLPLRPAAPHARPLADLAATVVGLRPDRPLTGLQVTGCTLDSRAVRPGDLYAALPGARVHGADFIQQAVAAGAVAVLTDPQGAAKAGSAVPLLVVPDPRAVLGDIAAWVFGLPAESMTVLGVTGTNGKTTTAFLLDAGLRAAGHVTGLLGTVLTRVADEVVPSVRTTPEAPDLQGLLAVMRERGVTAVSLEVSSHALALGRADGLVLDVAVFTNLTQDHLDFHASMADYEAAKARLFTPRHARQALINTDDAAGRRIAARATMPTSTYGTGGDWQAREVDLRPEGSSFRLTGPGVDLAAASRLPGAFNVSNAVAAIGALVLAGIDPRAAVEGVAALPGVPGRMERVEAGQDFLAIVDYAHTPDAVTTLLRAVRALTRGHVIVVLGCGGDRDRAKRPLMGRAAVQGADVAVLTSDNPRSEDPLSILAQMAAGAPDAQVEPDRRTAIAHAVSFARPGDVVVVAGKGHETGQEANGVVAPFDDRQVLAELLAQVTA